MAQIFPKHKLKKKAPVSRDEINENLQEIVGEIQGNLGEQNWAEDTFTRPQISSGAMVRMHSKKIEGPRHFHSVDPHVFRTFGDASRFGAELNWVKIPTNRAWTTLLTMEITCRSSLLWIMASFQQDYFDNVSEHRDRFFPGAMYALAIDGGRVHETMIGGSDRSNDRRGESYRYWRNPFTTDLLVPVSAGIHTISLQGRMVATTDYEEFSDSEMGYTVGNRELIVMEMT